VWERWTHLSHRVLLPVAAGTAIIFGAGVLADSQPAVLPYLPVLLIAVGGVALSTSLAFLAARRREAALRASAAAHAPFRRGHPLRPPAVRAVTPGPADGPRNGAPWPAAFSRTATWDARLATSSAGDVLWHEWLPASLPALGVEIVGPVPETLYTPADEEAPVAFSRRDAELGFASRMAGVGEDDGVPASNGPRNGDAIRVTGRSFPDLSQSAVELEALTAAPPHLRSLGEVAASRSFEGSAPAGGRSDAKSSCSTCLVTLDGWRWQPCPGCYQPICPDCVVDSLASYGATGCAGCVQGRPLTP
jgi:hypothetical protein